MILKTLSCADLFSRPLCLSIDWWIMYLLYGFEYIAKNHHIIYRESDWNLCWQSGKFMESQGIFSPNHVATLMICNLWKGKARRKYVTSWVPSVVFMCIHIQAYILICMPLHYRVDIHSNSLEYGIWHSINLNLFVNLSLYSFSQPTAGLVCRFWLHIHPECYRYDSLYRGITSKVSDIWNCWLYNHH